MRNYKGYLAEFGVAYLVGFIVACILQIWYPFAVLEYALGWAIGWTTLEIVKDYYIKRKNEKKTRPQ